MFREMPRMHMRAAWQPTEVVVVSRALPNQHPSSTAEVLPASSVRFSPAKLMGLGLTLASAIMASACADDTRACWFSASIGFEAVGAAGGAPAALGQRK